MCALLTSVVVIWPSAALQNHVTLIQNNCREVEQLICQREPNLEKMRFAVLILDNRRIKVLREHPDFLDVFSIVF